MQTLPEKQKAQGSRTQNTHQQTSKNVNPFFQYVNNSTRQNEHTAKTQSQIKLEQNIRTAQKDLKFDETSKNTDINQTSQVSSNKTNLVQAPQGQSKNKTSNTVQADDKSQNTKLEAHEDRSRSRQRRTKNNFQRGKSDQKQEHFHKTKLCPLYQKGACKKGSQCTYAHGQKQLRGLPNFMKTRLCIAFQNGQCKKPTNECKYAHGEQQLRPLRHEGFDQARRDRQPKNRRKEEKRFKKQSQSSHRNSNHRKYSDSREKDRRKDKKDTRSKEQSTPFFKKSIPLNKEYEKFLYGEGGKPETFNSSAYIIPNGPVPIPGHSEPLPNESFPPYNYSQTIYPPATQPYYSGNKEFPPYSYGREYEQARPESLPYTGKDNFFYDKTTYGMGQLPKEDFFYSNPNYLQGPYDSSYPRNQNQQYYDFPKEPYYKEKGGYGGENKSYFGEKGQSFSRQNPVFSQLPYQNQRSFYPPQYSERNGREQLSSTVQPYFGFKQSKEIVYDKSNTFQRNNSFQRPNNFQRGSQGGASFYSPYDFNGPRFTSGGEGSHKPKYPNNYPKKFSGR